MGRSAVEGSFLAGGVEDALSRLRDCSLEGAVGCVLDGDVLEALLVVLAGFTFGQSLRSCPVGAGHDVDGEGFGLLGASGIPERG